MLRNCFTRRPVGIFRSNGYTATVFEHTVADTLLVIPTFRSGKIQKTFREVNGGCLRIYQPAQQGMANLSSCLHFMHYLRTSCGKHGASCSAVLPHRRLFTGASRSSRISFSAGDLVGKSPAALQPYLKLIRADKPAGTWLLFWPCTWGVVLAADPGSLPDLKMVALFGVGAFLMRGAGCIVNDLWDRDLDRMVERTRDRPLASGEIQVLPAVIWLAGQLGVSLLILLQFNWYSILLGAGSLCLVSTYPAFKRFTYYPQIILGLTLNWGALMGYAAVRGYIDPFSVIPLYIAGICWTMVYDTIYAHQDKADDALVGIKSTALKFGDRTPTVLWEFSTIMLFALGVSGYASGLTWPFFVGLTGVGGHLLYQTFTLETYSVPKS